MTFKKKVLSVLIACFMLITVMSAISVSAAGKCLELDLSGMAESFAGSPGDGTNVGLKNKLSGWGETITMKHKNSGGAVVKMTRQYTANAEGEEVTPYILFENNSVSWDYNTVQFNIANKKMEQDPTSISFWADVDTYSAKAVAIVDLKVDYTSLAQAEEDWQQAAYDAKKEAEKQNKDYVAPVYPTARETYNYDVDLSVSTTGAICLKNGDSHTVNAGWNHYVITSRPIDYDNVVTVDVTAQFDDDDEGIKVGDVIQRERVVKYYDLYINGVCVETYEMYLPKDAVSINAVLAVANKWGTKTDGSSGFNNSLPAKAKYGQFEIYDSVLDESEVLSVFSSQKEAFGLGFANRIADGPEEVAPDAKSFKVTFENDVTNVKDLGDVVIVDKVDGKRIAVDFDASGKDVIITPKEYLTPGREYLVDFSIDYSTDFTFKAAANGIVFNSATKVESDYVEFDLKSEKSINAVIVIMGYDEEGFITNAVMEDKVFDGSTDFNVDAPGIGQCKTAKVMIWEKDGAKLLPLTNAYVFNK
ncbi:MAG: Ig-like domain-containing protein [Clostridia bacterium]|nr:Ig-like domain-containing protein [Clostridia bacterium]